MGRYKNETVLQYLTLEGRYIWHCLDCSEKETGGNPDGMRAYVWIAAAMEDAGAAVYELALVYARQLDGDVKSLIPELEQKLIQAQQSERQPAPVRQPDDDPEMQELLEKCQRLFDAAMEAYDAKDEAKAFALHKEAQCKCGYMYRKGLGTTVDKKKSLMWYEKAAGRGNPLAQFSCGDMYDKGEGTAACQGDADTQFKCGVMYYFGYGLSRQAGEQE